MGKDISQKLEAGFKIYININESKIILKRPQEGERAGSSKKTTDDQPPISSQVDTDENELDDKAIDDIQSLILRIIEIMESNGRRNDFVKTLKSIADKTLPINNIALNLLLDIGRFLDCNTVHFTSTNIILG